MVFCGIAKQTYKKIETNEFDFQVWDSSLAFSYLEMNLKIIFRLYHK
jgi:hypothetical protein